MVINKKGMMVKFLTTVILAIIIFAPACIISSKFFRLSDQAKNNFIDLVNDLKSVEKENLGYSKTAVITLDEKTAIIYFKPNEDQVEVVVDGLGTGKDYKLVFVNPKVCPSDKGCLCLFREPELDDDGWLDIGTVTITEKKPICDSFEESLVLETCEIGFQENINSRTCLNGFAIDRTLIERSKFAIVEVYYEVPRRTQLVATKKADIIFLSKENE
tara:strand:- start:1009 stop:1656 length:648 start_codon:yes stop_codon:yes gene_type:complete